MKNIAKLNAIAALICTICFFINIIESDYLFALICAVFAGINVVCYLDSLEELE